MKKTLFIIVAIVAIIISTVIVIGLEEALKNKKIKGLTSQKMETLEEAKKRLNIKKDPKKVDDFNYENLIAAQTQKPQKGETIAIIHVENFGDIYLKFFPNVAPKAVENFVTHAKNGYYNNLTFHRVINEFMIQGGDPKGDGTGGESIWKEPFDKEVDKKYLPIRGTISMASTMFPKSIGSQFFINQAHPKEENVEEMKLKNSPKNIIEAYKKYGGNMSLFLNYTVFGYVYKGMDVVDKIASVATDIKDKPYNDVKIKTIEIKKAE